MKTKLSLLLCTLLAIFALGCDGRSDFVEVTGPNGNNQGGGAPTGDIRVLVSAEELAGLFPAPVDTEETLGQTLDIEDPRIATYMVFVYDAEGKLVTSVNAPRTNEGGLNVLFQGLQVTNFRVVIAGLDVDGELVGAAQASDITPVPNSVLQITGEVFAPLDGFVLPVVEEEPIEEDDDGEPVEGELNMEVEVTNVDGIYRVTWAGGTPEGGPIASLSAVPVELIDEIGPGSISDPAVAARVFSVSSTTGGDSIEQPVAMTVNPITGAFVNPAFEGFDGSVYRVSVSRSNGDSGFLDIALDDQG